MFEINDDYICELLSKIYEDDEQIMGLLQEECAELIQAVSKYNRKYKNGLDMIKEEITHVAVSLALTCKILKITKEDIDYEIQNKANKDNMFHNNVS